MNIKGFILSIVAFILMTASASAQTIEQDISGVWSVGDGDHSKVVFTKDTDGLWNGVITETDVERSVGKLLFTAGSYQAEDNTIEGKLIHPDSGLRVGGTIILMDAQKIHVLAHQFWITKSFYWTK